MRTNVYAILLVCLTVVVVTAHAGDEFPGFWVEAEHADGHTQSKPNANASAGAALAWFTEGKKNSATFPGFEQETEAYLYVRYARGAPTDGAVEVWHGAADDAQRIGTVVLPATGGWGRFMWGRTNIGKLPEHETVISLRATSETADIDCWGILMAGEAHNGRWMPPDHYQHGKPVGEPYLLTSTQVESVRIPLLGHIIVWDGAREAQCPIEVTVRNNLTEGMHARVEVLLINSATDQVVAQEEKHAGLEHGESKMLPFNLAIPDYGHFTVKGRIVTDNESHAAEATLAVIRPPHDGPRPDSMFGLGIGDSDEDREIGRMIGVKWRRGIPGLYPDIVSPAPGQYWEADTIKEIREIVRQWESAGMMCLGYVDYNLSWNVMPDPQGKPIQRHQNRPRDLAVHADMVARMIAPLADLVEYWELWNEPWVQGWTWRSGTAQDYRDMTRLIWDRVKPVHPEIKLIGGGSTPYLRDIVYAKGATNAGYIDGSCTHPYGPPDRSTPAPAALEAVMNARWSQSGGSGGIWATEVGAAEFMFPEQPEHLRPFAVARSVAPVYLLNKLGAGNTPIRNFFFASKYNRSFSGDTFNWWDGKNPKPAVPAYATMTHLLEDTLLLGDIWSKSRVGWALHFTHRDGRSVVALWAEEPYQGQVILPEADWTAINYLGQKTGTIADDYLVLPFEPMTVTYLLSGNPVQEVAEAIAAARFEGFNPVDLTPLSFLTPIEERPALRVKMENLTAQFQPVSFVASSNDVHFQNPVDPFVLGPYESRTVSVPMIKSHTSEVNRYPVMLVSDVAGFSFTNHQSVQAAVALPMTPVLDGRLDEWDTVTPATMVSRGGKDWTEIALDPSKAAERLGQSMPDQTVLYRLWTAWDADALYFAAEIPDSSLQPKPSFSDNPNAFPFLFDALQLAWDLVTPNPDDLLTGHPLWEKSLACDVDYEFAVAFARDPETGALIPEIHRLKAPGTNLQTFYPTNPDLKPPLGPLENPQAIIRYDEQKQSLVYEIALPLTTLPELHHALTNNGMEEVRFAWGVIDRGGRGATYWTQETDLVREGAYGFSPHWGGGGRRYGGRILTDWSYLPQKMP